MKPYLVNINSKKIHLSNSNDGRCKIKQMREEYKVYFDALDDALHYPNENRPLAKPCAFCLNEK